MAALSTVIGLKTAKVGLEHGEGIISAATMSLIVAFIIFGIMVATVLLGIYFVTGWDWPWKLSATIGLGALTTLGVVFVINYVQCKSQIDRCEKKCESENKEYQEICLNTVKKVRQQNLEQSTAQPVQSTTQPVQSVQQNQLPRTVDPNQ
jgi:hypothetical protein